MMSIVSSLRISDIAMSSSNFISTSTLLSLLYSDHASMHASSNLLSFQRLSNVELSGVTKHLLIAIQFDISSHIYFLSFFLEDLRFRQEQCIAMINVNLICAQPHCLIFSTRLLISFRSVFNTVNQNHMRLFSACHIFLNLAPMRSRYYRMSLRDFLLHIQDFSILTLA